MELFDIDSILFVEFDNTLVTAHSFKFVVVCPYMLYDLLFDVSFLYIFIPIDGC